MEFKKKIEDMTEAELKQQVKTAYETEMPKLTMIPYVGLPDELVIYEYPELTALCPMTGIQDLYTIKIEFTPDMWVPELKSLKMYFLAYRDLGISHEHLASKIHKDFKKAVKPEDMDITLDVAVRGGIKTTVIL